MLDENEAEKLFMVRDGEGTRRREGRERGRERGGGAGRQGRERQSGKLVRASCSEIGKL